MGGIPASMTMSAFDVLALDRGDLRKLPLHLRKPTWRG
jgi:ATP-dependent DNA ligase